MSPDNRSPYFVPQPARWPIEAAVALLFMAAGGALWLNEGAKGRWVFAAGVAILAYVLFRWFGSLISEGRRGLYNDQVERSVRVGMAWFIFSEVVVFGALFAALFYTRVISVPDLASGDTHALLWPGFKGGWPASGPAIEGTFSPMKALGIPLLNTIMLLISGAAVTLADKALDRSRRGLLIVLLTVPVVVGVLFLRNQASEYYNAYSALHLTFSSGAYGQTFFILTGLHGLHVAIGTAFMTLMLGRTVRGDFTANDHLALQAASWYWHFVGIVWLILYVLVYWL
jgi:cytochrome c oxidase subunit III